MNDECRMTNVEWAEEFRASGVAPTNDWSSLRFLNLRYTVATIEKRLDDIDCLKGIKPRIVATLSPQLDVSSFSPSIRATPSKDNRATVFSPNGAKHFSPGQRPGSRHVMILSPEGAAHLRPTNPRHGSPLQGSGSWGNHFLGRCPRLGWAGPLALKNSNRKVEVAG